MSKDEKIVEVRQNATPLQFISLTLNLFDETPKDPFRLSIRGIDNSSNSGQWSPEQWFSWDYMQDKNKINKLMTNDFNSLFILLCMFLGRLFL